ncbi:hypothetical protein TrST_g3154 [Triparma strigata]|uniref:Uncharacterized protein n=1 Tax=Triparma strigata TaxID=1606541 RepID=A0A9W7F0L6_9STRA|nr:hypothetical protein TrST_g3154 [Triparma strigata]
MTANIDFAALANLSSILPPAPAASLNVNGLGLPSTTSATTTTSYKQPATPLSQYVPFYCQQLPPSVKSTDSILSNQLYFVDYNSIIIPTSHTISILPYSPSSPSPPSPSSTSTIHISYATPTSPLLTLTPTHHPTTFLTSTSSTLSLLSFPLNLTLRTFPGSPQTSSVSISPTSDLFLTSDPLTFKLRSLKSSATISATKTNIKGTTAFDNLGTIFVLATFPEKGDICELSLYDVRDYNRPFTKFKIDEVRFCECLKLNSGVSVSKGVEIYERCRGVSGSQLIEFNEKGTRVLVKFRGGYAVVLDAFTGEFINVLTEHVEEWNDSITVASWVGESVAVGRGGEVAVYKNVGGGCSGVWKGGAEGEVRGVRGVDGWEGGIVGSKVLSFWSPPEA